MGPTMDAVLEKHPLTAPGMFQTRPRTSRTSVSRARAATAATWRAHTGPTIRRGLPPRNSRLRHVPGKVRRCQGEGVDLQFQVGLGG